MTTPDLLTLRDIAARTGRTPAAIRQLHKRSTANRAADTPGPLDLPAPDLRVGTLPAWRPDTIDAWLDTATTTARPAPKEPKP